MVEAERILDVPNVAGRRVVIGFLLLVALIVPVFLWIQASGKGAPERNFQILSATAGLKDLDEGRNADAVSRLTDAIEAGGLVDLTGYRGEAYLRLGRFRDAEKDFRAAVRLDADSAVDHGGLGRALLEQGKFDEAVREFDAAIRLIDARPARGRPDRIARTGSDPNELKRLLGEASGRRPPIGD